jgi:hypothetical protein
MTIDKYVLSKFVVGKNDEDEDYLSKAICFCIEKIGYEETMNLTLQ